jgi:hypothetical protein
LPRQLDGLEDLHVAGAAAEVAGEPARISSRVGAGFAASSAFAAIMKPGVQ